MMKEKCLLSLNSVVDCSYIYIYVDFPPLRICSYFPKDYLLVKVHVVYGESCEL